MISGTALAGIAATIGGLIDKAVPDKDQAARIKSSIDQQELASATSIIIAEAQGDSWLQRNWRPLLMLWFAGLVGAHWLGFTPPNLPESVVNNLLDIVKVGVGGYVLGRSGEKIANALKK